MAREEAKAKYVTKKKKELTFTHNTMLQGLHRMVYTSSAALHHH